MARPSKKIKYEADRFVKALETADGRCSSVRKIRKRIAELEKDSGANSIVKRELCKRAAFISLQIEAIESASASGQVLDWNAYLQLLNTYLGMLKALGVEPVRTDSLTDYLEKK